ncbi:MAG: tRNA (N(6)-L-threonylcarbamoyladenosine(37)-C(2))-methylthiotransferase MtaB [Coriobacteriia bacterium]|nr:tRNA (N(6)-L-threonylcarbamoyladenosine(37)-C(2))-methylthiotransferase MtaB [Coriobacteriia bacterium]
MADLSVAMRTLGCKVNRVEAEKIAARLLGTGVAIVDEDEAAVVVVTTCTVTGEADHKARKAVRHALGLPQSPVVVVTGCLASVDPDGLAALGERVIVEPDKDLVPARVAAVLGTRICPAGVVPRIGEAFRTRAVVKVEDGCDAFCAYCIIPYARGVPRSVPVADVEAEVRSLVDAGVAEAVLTGINIGRYSDAGLDLSGLLERLATTGLSRMRISSIEPGDVDERFLQVAASIPAFCAHLHIPLQAGCDATLAAMGRTYDTAGFAAVVQRAREALPGLAITTDVMTGFPGETDEHFEQTLAFVEACGFSRLHVFRYSPRAGTPAAGMSHQVPAAVKADRARRLRELDGRLRARFAQASLGEEVEVLIERVNDDGSAEGTTREYLHVVITGADLAEGDVVMVWITGAEQGRMTAAW